MTLRFPACLLLAATLALPVRSAERNAWPFWVGTETEAAAGGRSVRHEALGPLFEEREDADGSNTEIWRPIFLRRQAGDAVEAHLFYPLFNWRSDGQRTSFDFFAFLNTHQRRGADGQSLHAFDLWPFYFSRATGDPATSYHAVFPLAGDIKHRFGKDSLRWFLWPLYTRVEARGRVSYCLPWPVVRYTEGAGHRGFGLWPLFDQTSRAGDYRHQTYLWPLIYHHADHLSAEQPSIKLGFLPFYTRDTGPDYLNENFLWPFFGHTRRTGRVPYVETRYLWPFLVQGRGPERTINRWAPLYTHSVIHGYDKTWFLWPLIRHARWQERGVVQEKDQFLFFLYWSQEQRRVDAPAGAPAAAYRRHFWPLLSVWDNGAGRRQVQFLSPLEVFLPDQPIVRDLYTPLFALYRHDRRGPDDVRWRLLWGAVSSRRSPEGREFHLGPLFGSQASAAGARVTVGGGLLSWRRPAGAPRWRFSLFDFRRLPATVPATAAPAP